MTREEAIKILKEFKTFCEGILWDSKYIGRVEALDMAIEALSAETDMSEYADRLWKIAYERGKAESKQHNKDAISREGLLKSWEELSPRGRTEFDQVIMTIPALPSVDAVQGWIPCSERLPKEKQEVYVTVYFIEGDTGRAYGYMDGFGKWHLFSAVEGTLNSGYEVIAWMPLPKPYRGEQIDSNT